MKVRSNKFFAEDSIEDLSNQLLKEHSLSNQGTFKRNSTMKQKVTKEASFHTLISSKDS